MSPTNERFIKSHAGPILSIVARVNNWREIDSCAEGLSEDEGGEELKLVFARQNIKDFPIELRTE